MDIYRLVIKLLTQHKGNYQAMMKSKKPSRKAKTQKKC